MGYYIDINKGLHLMTFWIDPTFAASLPLLAVAAVIYCTMITENLKG